jgi:hypothetical protein
MMVRNPMETPMTNSNDFNETELLAEHNAAKEAARIVEEAKLEAEREQRRKLEQDERANANIKNSKHLHEIVKHIPKARRWLIVESDFKLFIDGVDCSWNYEFRAEWTNDTWRSRPTGRHRFSLGDYGSRKSFPQRKDGTFNYKAIAEDLCYYADRQISKATIENTRKYNAACVAKMQHDLGLEEYWGPMAISPSADEASPVFVKVKIERAMTPSETIALHTALKGLGLVK